jgi:hypothetical protein
LDHHLLRLLFKKQKSSKPKIVQVFNTTPKQHEGIFLGKEAKKKKNEIKQENL